VIQQLLSEKKTHVAFKKSKALMAFEAERPREAKAI
jgi:flagellar protein FlbT